MEPNWGWDLLRNILSFLDSAGYALVSGVYNVFFTVANAQIFSGDIIDTFFSRIQLILATFMIFSLAITALNIIINPDAFKDKQKGAGKIVTRVALSLVMLTLVVPFDIPNDNNNPLNEQISSNGILFGFLYQFQDSVMQDNILGKLILGSNADSNEGNFGDLDNMSDIGGTLATTVAKAFITPTLNDDSDDSDVNPDGITEDDVACPEAITDYDYSDPNLSYKTLVKYINVTCDSEEQGEVYIFDYTPLLGLVCSIIMAIIIIGFTLDVAVRAIKLALLRLIAPIPIISYIIPGQEKNGAFNNWLKTLASTYMDLFLRIIIIYFGAYVILVISEGGVNIWQNSPGFYTSLFASVFIIIGVLVFMKQAPKFFQDMLGLKGDGKLFSGIGTMLGAAALTGGLVGSVATGARAAWEENKMAKRPAWMGVGGAITSGITSGVGGLFTGAKTLATTDNKVPSSVMAAMQKRNAMRASHSTLPGRISSGAFGMFTGRTLAERDQAILDLNKEAASQAKNLKSLEEEEAAKNVAYITQDLVDANNNIQRGVHVDYNALMAAMEGTDANGNFTYQSVKYSRDNFGKHVTDEILKQTTQAYVNGTAVLRTGADSFANNGKIRSQKRTTDYAFSQAGGKAAETYGDGDYSKLGPSIGAATEATTDMSTNIKNIKHRANHNANKNS